MTQRTLAVFGVTRLKNDVIVAIRTCTRCERLYTVTNTRRASDKTKMLLYIAPQALAQSAEVQEEDFRSSPDGLEGPERSTD